MYAFFSLADPCDAKDSSGKRKPQEMKEFPYLSDKNQSMKVFASYAPRLDNELDFSKLLNFDGLGYLYSTHDLKHGVIEAWKGRNSFYVSLYAWLIT